MAGRRGCSVEAELGHAGDAVHAADAVGAACHQSCQGRGALDRVVSIRSIRLTLLDTSDTACCSLARRPWGKVSIERDTD